MRTAGAAARPAAVLAPGLAMLASRSILFGCRDRGNHDLFDRDPLQIGELLTERVSFSRDPTDDAVCRSQLLHDQLELAVESTQPLILIHLPRCGNGPVALAWCAPQGTSAALVFLARRIDGHCCRRCRGSVWSAGRIGRRHRVYSIHRRHALTSFGLSDQNGKPTATSHHNRAMRPTPEHAASP